jgi:Holliday junction resolvase RusA-like endonuclease
MKFIMPGEPQGKARGRTFIHSATGKPTTMTPEKTVLYENLVKMCYQQQCGEYTEKPLIMRIEAYYKIPKSTPKKNIKPMLSGEIRPCKKPDIDNVAKVILDSLNGIAYKDDTQVVSLQVYKYYAETPEVQVALIEAISEDSSN